MPDVRPNTIVRSFAAGAFRSGSENGAIFKAALADGTVDRWFWPRRAVEELRDRLSEHLGSGVYGPDVDPAQLAPDHPYARFAALRPAVTQADYAAAPANRLLNCWGFFFEEDLLAIELQALDGSHAEQLYDASLLHVLRRALAKVLLALDR